MPRLSPQLTGAGRLLAPDRVVRPGSGAVQVVAASCGLRRGRPGLVDLDQPAARRHRGQRGMARRRLAAGDTVRFSGRRAPRPVPGMLSPAGRGLGRDFPGAQAPSARASASEVRAMTASISLRGVSRRFGATWALADIDLDLAGTPPGPAAHGRGPRAGVAGGAAAPSRSPPDASTDAFSSSLTTTVFSQRGMRRLEASLRRATPKGHETFIFRTAPHQGLVPTSGPPCVQDTPRHAHGSCGSP